MCLETGVSGVESGGDCFCRFLWEGMSLRKGVEMVDDRSGRFRFSYVFYAFQTSMENEKNSFKRKSSATL